MCYWATRTLHCFVWWWLGHCFRMNSSQLWEEFNQKQCVCNHQISVIYGCQMGWKDFYNLAASSKVPTHTLACLPDSLWWGFATLGVWNKTSGTSESNTWSDLKESWCFNYLIAYRGKLSTPRYKRESESYLVHFITFLCACVWAQLSVLEFLPLMGFSCGE